MYLVKSGISICKMKKIKTFIYINYFVLLTVMPGFCINKTFGQEASEKTDFLKPFKICWELKDTSIDTFASDNNYVTLSKTDGSIFQFNSFDGKQIWETQIGKKLSSIPYLIDGTTIITSYLRNSDNREIYIRKINSQTGVTDWNESIRTMNETPIISIEVPGKLLTISEDLSTLATSLSNGRVLWRSNISGKLFKSTKLNNLVYLLTTDGNILTIDPTDGSNKSLGETGIQKLSSFTVKDELIFLGDKNGQVYEIDTRSNRLKKSFRTGGEISSINVIEDKILVASNDNFIYLYSFEKEKILWKKRLPGRLIDAPLFRDETIFAATTATNEIFAIEISEGRNINQITLDEGEVTKRVSLNQSGVLVLTNKRLLKFGSGECKK